MYCLPDGYEVVDSSLDDVKRSLAPSFSQEEVRRLSADNSLLARDVHGVSYLPGFVGLNNLTHTDYFNTVLHALSHVEPIRDFFLLPENYAGCRDSLVNQFGSTLRKLWSRHNFKSVVSPQELLHEVTTASQRRFQIGRKVRDRLLPLLALTTASRSVWSCSSGW